MMQGLVEENSQIFQHVSEVSYFIALDAKTPELVREWLLEVEKMEAEVLARLPQPLACTAGCAHCCHQAISAMPIEVVMVHEMVTDRPRIAASAERIRSMRNLDRMQQGIPCALLGQDNRCTVYEWRPGACRATHSLSVQACEEGQAPPFLAELLMLPKAGLYGGMRAFHERGLDTDPVELVMALAAIAEVPTSEALGLWLQGKRLFPDSVRVTHQQARGNRGPVQIRIGKQRIS